MRVYSSEKNVSRSGGRKSLVNYALVIHCQVTTRIYDPRKGTIIHPPISKAMTMVIKPCAYANNANMWACDQTGYARYRITAVDETGAQVGKKKNCVRRSGLRLLQSVTCPFRSWHSLSGHNTYFMAFIGIVSVFKRGHVSAARYGIE